MWHSEKLDSLKLILEQQSAVDSGISWTSGPWEETNNPSLSRPGLPADSLHRPIQAGLYSPPDQCRPDTMAAGLVNDGTEAIRGYGRLASALNVRQQAILRKSGPFVKPTAAKGCSKPWDKPAFNAMSSVAAAKKKARSRDKGKKIQGLPPHPAPLPVSFPPLPAPAKFPVLFRGVDIWKTYKQEKLPPSDTGHSAYLCGTTWRAGSCSILPVREAQPPTRPSPRGLTLRTREEWGNMGVTSPPATTGAITRASTTRPIWVHPGQHLYPQ